MLLYLVHISRNSLLMVFNAIYRKMRMWKYSNTQRALDMFMNEFKDTYGDATIIFGDWDAGSCCLRGLPPTKGRSFLKLFRKHMHDVFYSMNTIHPKSAMNANKMLSRMFVRAIKVARGFKLYISGLCRTLQRKRLSPDKSIRG